MVRKLVFISKAKQYFAKIRRSRNDLKERSLRVRVSPNIRRRKSWNKERRVLILTFAVYWVYDRKKAGRIRLSNTNISRIRVRINTSLNSLSRVVPKLKDAIVEAVSPIGDVIAIRLENIEVGNKTDKILEDFSAESFVKKSRNVGRSRREQRRAF